jgi:hypothetical protein
MSLYRQPGRASAPMLAAVGVGTLVLGLAAGFGLGRATAPDEHPSVREAVSALRADVRPALSGLGLVRIEYPQAVRAGEVTAPTEYAAAKADVQRVSGAVAPRLGDLRTLSPREAAAFEQALAQLRAAVSARQDPDEVVRLSEDAEAALRRAVGQG